MKRVLPLVAALVLVSRCSGAVTPAPTSSTGPGIGASAVLVGTGDIGACGSPAAIATAQLLDRIPGTVFTTGDNAYPSGSAANYRDCYHPTWGRHRDRTRPVPGNHEYESAHATPYYDYFGANAGPAGMGYYSYRAGTWHIVALNSEASVSPGSAQMAWLRDDLTNNATRCTAVIWHRPLFTSGPNGQNMQLRDVWRILYEFDVDLVLNGHDHLYQRFAPQDPDGRMDLVRGIRQITVGTGGAGLYTPVTSARNAEVIGTSWGVLKLTLADGSYQWEFVPTEGMTFRDAGSAQCH